MIANAILLLYNINKVKYCMGGVGVKKGRLSEEEKETVKKMRDQSHGYGEIAKVLECSKDRVRRYCSNNNLGGYRSGPDIVENAYEIFINGFNEKHGESFVYLSGFEGSESIVKIKCRQCNHEFTRSAQISRKNKKIACSKCKENENEERRELKEMIRNNKKKLNKGVSVLKKKEKELNKKSIYKVCATCGYVFIGKRNSLCCSNECGRKYKNRRKELRNKHISGSSDDGISLDKLIERDGNECYICDKKCDSNDYVITDEGHYIVGRNYPSIEHVIPVSKGGQHTWGNVKLAHMYCNTIKSDNDLFEETGQLKLMI